MDPFLSISLFLRLCFPTGGVDMGRKRLRYFLCRNTQFEYDLIQKCSHGAIATVHPAGTSVESDKWEKPVNSASQWGSLS